MPHLRPPAFSHGFVSFLWGLALGGFVGLGTAILIGLLTAALVFFAVRVLGDDRYRA
jgi:hypothetical protein